MKKTVYLDTTVPSHLFDDRESIKTYTEVTQNWWQEESGNYDIWISDETIAELNSCPWRKSHDHYTPIRGKI